MTRWRDNRVTRGRGYVKYGGGDAVWVHGQAAANAFVRRLSDYNSDMADYPHSGRPLRPEQSRPVKLDLQLPEQMLRITWADNVTSEFQAGFLRRNCPCATCRSERDKPATGLPILSARQAGDIRVTGGDLVGNYAIQLHWSDGHNTGIYDFRLLRELDEERRGG